MKKYIFTFIMIIVVVIVQLLLSNRDANQLRIYFLDVGQGDSVLIITTDDKVILIDSGKNESTVKELNKISFMYNRRIDYVIASHSDADHIGGFTDLLNMYDVDNFIINETNKNSSTLKNLLLKIANKNIYRIAVKSDSDFILGCCTKLDFVWPINNSNLIDDKDENSRSISLIITYNQFNAIFDGDLSSNVEDELAKNGLFYDVDLLKVSHHGSDSASSKYFLDIIKPEYTIISVGKNNAYKHPNSNVLNRLTQMKSKILRTDELGTIYIHTDGYTVNY